MWFQFRTCDRTVSYPPPGSAWCRTPYWSLGLDIHVHKYIFTDLECSYAPAIGRFHGHRRAMRACTAPYWSLGRCGIALGRHSPPCTWWPSAQTPEVRCTYSKRMEFKISIVVLPRPVSVLLWFNLFRKGGQPESKDQGHSGPPCAWPPSARMREVRCTYTQKIEHEGSGFDSKRLDLGRGCSDPPCKWSQSAQTREARCTYRTRTQLKINHEK